MFLDATCSGIQHLSALMEDYDLGSQVNLIPQLDTDDVSDIYSYILNPINKEINEFGLNNPEFSHFSRLKFSRKDVKLSIMTKVYNVSIFGIKEQLISQFDKYISDSDIADLIRFGLEEVNLKGKVYYKATGIDSPVILSNKDLFKIAKIINNTIFLLFPSLKEIYDYLISIAKLLSKAKLPVSWSTPSGLKITQNYLKSEAHKASIRSGNKPKTIVLRKTNRDKPDYRKQNQAIIPNIIHSLDASHLINLINRANLNGLTNVISIHDCFGIHPNKMNSLKQLVITEFINLYTEDDFLAKFHKQVMKSLVDNKYEIITTTNKIKNIGGLSSTKTVKYVIIDDEEVLIPNLPKKGNLNLNLMKNSKNFIT